VRQDPAPSPELGLARAAPPLREPASVLRIIEGPELVVNGDKKALCWKTSAPADSLLTYGRGEAFEHIVAKDSTLTATHRFELPSLPSIEFCRFSVISMDGDGNVATGSWSPGRGPQGSLLADVSESQSALCAGGANPVAAWADYDEDGDLDVALCVDGAAKLLRQEDGQLKDVTAKTCPGLAGRAACWGDFNADGHLDLLAGGEKPTLYRNSGPPRWTFEPVPQALPVGGVAEAMFADLNADGLPDILAADSSGAARTLLNGGPPDFKFQEAKLLDLAAGTRIAIGGVVCADFTGDGRTDVWYSGAGGILFKNEGGRLIAAKQAVPYFGAASNEAPAAAVADFDGDGDLDLYVPPHGSGAGGVLLVNNGLGQFRKAESVGELASFRDAATCAASADLTGNGSADIVVGLASGGVKVFLNLGDGTFMDGTDLCRFPAANVARPTSIVLADVNGDSAPDLFASLTTGAVLLENCSIGAGRNGFITVRPLGARGVSSALIRIQDGSGSRAIITSQVGSSGLGPLECTFGVRNLPEGRIEVRFSDGKTGSLRWNKSAGPRILPVQRTE